MRLEYFQMVDRIEALDPVAGVVRALCVVPETSPVFDGHFPGYPILPGVLMIEMMAQTGGWLAMALCRFERMAFLAQVKEAKLRSFVTPGRSLQTEVRLVHEGSGFAVAAGRIRADDRPVADAEITYRVLPFPNEVARRELLATARRVQVPERLIGAGPDNA